MTRSTCARCGGAILPGDRFCGSCGLSVAPETLSPTPELGGTALGTVGASTLAQTERSPWGTVAARLQQATLGEFEILTELGRGGMAAVYLARDLALNRAVAIKVMAPGLLLGPAMVERFRQEAITVANLQHAHIVSIHAVRQVEDLHFFVMQFVPGRTIEGVLRELGSLPIPVALAWLYQVGSALAYAHRRGVIHRDVKPGNVLLNIDGEAVVTDFGIAKVTENPALTQTGAVVGTPRYMSPEQCYAKELTGASDQYSLGIVAYEMLAGRPPFTGSSFSLMRAHTDDPPPPLRDVRPDLPPAVEAALMRMLAKRPEQRFATLTEALAGLGAVPLPPADPLHTTLQELAAATERLDALRDVLRTPASPIPRTRERINPRLATPQTGHPVTERFTVTVAPPPTDLEPGATASLHADVKTSSGQTIDRPSIVWESDDIHVASVDRATGLLTAHEPGRVKVTASVGLVKESVEVVVGEARATKVEIVPPAAPLTVGETVTLSAVVTNRFGVPLSNRQVAWSAEHPNVATITRDPSTTASGSVTVRAVAPGATTILASCAGALALAKLTVVSAPEPVVPKPPRTPTPEAAWPASWSERAPVQAAPPAPPPTPLAPPQAPSAAERAERIRFDTPSSTPAKSFFPVPEAGSGPTTSPPPGKSTPGEPAPNAIFPPADDDATRKFGVMSPPARDPVISAPIAAPVFDEPISRRAPAAAAPSETSPAPSTAAAAPNAAESAAPTVSAPAPARSKSPRRPLLWAAPVVLLLAGGAYLFTRGAATGTDRDSTLTTEPPLSSGVATGESTRTPPPVDSPRGTQAPSSGSAATGAGGTAATDPPPPPPVSGGKSSPTAPVARRVQLRASRTDNILPGQNIEISAIVRDESGKPIRNAPIRWSSSNPAVATVDATGKVLAIAEGTARISAVSGAATEVISVAVNNPPPDPAAVVSVEIAEIERLTAGDSVRLNAVARNAYGSAATGAAIAWTSSNPDVATVSAGGVLVARGAGSSTITASSGGRSAERRATVRARELPPPPKPETAAPPPPKSESELVSEIRALMARYTRAIESRDTAQMRAVFPAAPAELLRNWQDTFSDARDGIQMRGPEVEVLDTPRDAVGTQVRLSGQRVAVFYSKRNRRDMQVPTKFTAVVQRVANGWRIVSIR